MATIIENEIPDHLITVLDDAGKMEIVLVGKGERAYLWIGNNAAGPIALVEGQEVLRALAKTILKEVDG